MWTNPLITDSVSRSVSENTDSRQSMEVRHCNYTEMGYDIRKDSRVRIVARAFAVLSVLGLLPKREVSFVFAFSDIEMHDRAVPMVTFQRGKAAKRLIRVPMHDQLDGSWSRQVEQLVIGHESAWPFERKRGRTAFWRGTDSSVPALDCDAFKHRACFVNNETARYFPRLNLPRLSLTKPRRIDARLSGVKPRSSNIGMDQVYRQLGVLERHPRDWTIQEQLQRRFLIDVDGSSQSTRLYWALLANSVVLKQDTTNCNWYSDRLRKHLHFVPLRSDLADLPRQVSRLLLRPSLARSIARRSTTFARRWLSHEDAMHYLARVLNAIEESQRPL
ncbi:unnamed protein product [Polarella glacialis]|uniref:Glycosyl transferase CAP10 domain-containing protein n=1 Tax=Polarella glacialis TaxID=89957 RepID=A0A813HH66_POLGL|nr:unnamed protein product [Polarella glacialis]